MRQSIKKNIFLFLIVFLILLGFPIKSYAIYVPSGGSYEDSSGSFADKSSPGALKIYYMVNGSYKYSSVSFSKGTITKEGDRESYTQEGK